jgi:hypothetical protein
MGQRENIVQAAQNFVGYSVASGKYKQVIDLYNSEKPLAVGYTVKYTDQWCDTGVSAFAIKAGIPRSIFPRECGCERHIEAFKAIGAWQENENYAPLPGDVIFFDWDDSGAGDCTGFADHVGIVEKCVNGIITTIECNYGQSVGRRTIAVNARYIRGFALPKYADEAPAPAPAPQYSQTILNAVADIGMNSPGYWQNVIDGTTAASADNVKALIDKYHTALVSKG